MEITVLALKFQQPIADLIDRLISRDYGKPREAGSGYYECSYSASAIILLVVMLESIIQRNRYFFLKNNPSIKTKSVAYGYLQETLHYRRHAQIQELFELRNAIAHNHIWEIEHIWSNATGRQHKQSNLVPGTHKMRSPPLNSKIRVQR